MLEDKLLKPRKTKRASALRTHQLYGNYSARHIRIMEMQLANQQRNIQRGKSKPVKN
jgi:hypothetical protein